MPDESQTSAFGTFFRCPLIIDDVGNEFPIRNALQFSSSVSSITDDPVNELTQIPMSGGAGVALGPTITNTSTGTINSLSTVDGSGNKADVIRFTATGTVTVNGLDHQVTSRRIWLTPATSGTILKLAHLAAGGTAGQKIQLPDSVTSPLTLPANGAIELVYDSTSAVWRLEGFVPGAAGSASVGSNGQVQATDGAGGFRAVPWTWDGGTNVTADSGVAYRIKNNAGTGQWDALIREGSGTNESVSFNGDAAGDASASAPNAYVEATRFVSISLNDSSAYVAAESAAAAGVAVVKLTPGLSINPNGVAASMLGGGTGVLSLRTTVEPSASTPPSSSFGTGIWADASTTQLLTVATVGGSGDIAPLSKLYVSAVFASDASRNLTSAESRATALAVSGTITATRTLTNTAMRPTTNHVVTVQNNCAQSVAYAWSSGTGITIASGKGAVISGDGTNAVLVATFQLSAGSGVTWANDLSTSSNSAQYVSSISGSNGTGGAVAVGGSVSLTWASSGGGITINQTVLASGTAADSNYLTQGSSSGNGGNLNLKSGSNSAGGGGNVNIYEGTTLVMQLSGAPVAGDMLCTGTGTVLVRTAKGSNSTVWSVNSSGVVGYNQVTPAMIAPGSNGQFHTTTGGVVAWGNTATFYADTGTVPSTGVLRTSNGVNMVVAENSGGTGAIVALASTSNDIYLGSDGTGAANQATNVRCYPSSAGIFGISNTNYFVWQTSQLLFRQPALFTSVVGGDSSTSAAFRWAAASITLAATTTATAAQYSCPFLTITNSTTGNALILPNTTGAMFYIKNTGSSMVAKAAGQTGVTIGANSRACIVCNGTDFESYP